MRILKEEVLSLRGGWLIKGRIVIYHPNSSKELRRAEIYLEMDKSQQFQEVGWSIEDLQYLADLLYKFKQKHGEL